MRMFLAGEWVDRPRKIEVLFPFDGSVVDTVPQATREDVETALAAAVRGAEVMRRVPAYERSLMLKRAAELLEERVEEFGRTITLEEGKVLAESLTEASRSAQTLMLSAEEAKRLGGEVVPLEGAPGGQSKFGFTLRVPCGVVLAITPFNFPLNLVCHKVGPALAAGNAVMIKPASDTPLSALKLTEILLEAGVPAEGIQCITGRGGDIGDALCADPRVRKISFTGSREVGEHICGTAGLKKVTMELGSNSPLIVMPDADLEQVARAVAVTGYANAGQVCISTQRVYAAGPIYGDLIDVLRTEVETITTGNPLQEGVRMGPMVREPDAERVERWIADSASAGARLVTGGGRQGALMQPTLVADVSTGQRISCDELFGPAVGLTPVGTIEEGIALANDTPYGLSTAIFTQNINWAMQFAREAEAGNIHINWGTMWRADLMPYGGIKESGFGKEGPRYAVEEMTELKMVVFHLPEG